MTDEKSVRDEALELLVSLTNGQKEPSPEGGFGLTLYVGGVVVSGRLVPNWQWMEEVADQVQNSYPVPAEESSDAGERLGMTVVFDHVAREMRDRQAADKKLQAVADQLTDEQVAAAGQAQRLGFIHLVNARFMTGERVVPANGSYWRGRLDEVDGWSPGTFG